MKLLTWLDVRRVIAKKTSFYRNLPAGINRISCFSDGVEIGISSADDREKASQVLKEWFGDWYRKDSEDGLQAFRSDLISLDLDNATLQIEFVVEEISYESNVLIRPFWQEISYLAGQDNNNYQSVKYRNHYQEKPQLIAFHSFKGGVGRTLHLAAYLFALLDRAKKVNKAINILVIDADLEAPGLTYWNQSEARQPQVSFIDFLEIYHYSPIDLDKSLKLFSQSVKQSIKLDKKSNIYFLPAFIDENDLLDTPILPENLAKDINNQWLCTDAIYQLGQALNADFIFIDLRAGLSEISSPLLFDPRIERFLVTTLNQQSIQGTSLILQQISQITPLEEQVNSGDYFDPSVIISLLKPKFKELADFDNAITQLQASYVESQEDSLSTRLEINDTLFAEELMYINNWEDCQQKLSGTSVFRLAEEWATTKLEMQKDSSNNRSESEHPALEDVKKLKEISQKYIYAEEGEGDDLLMTESLRNLALNFQSQLPNVISIGSKGAGKTFNYLQLSRLQYWEYFLSNHDNFNIADEDNPSKTTYIFPFMQSINLKDKARYLVEQARDNVLQELGNSKVQFSPSDNRDEIKNSLKQDWNETEWTRFWINKIAESLGMSDQENFSLSDIDSYLKEKLLRVIFLFDGLEDIFPNISSEEKQQIALKALISNLLNKLSEIRQSNLGIIIFLRRDFVRYTITQNASQFESRYRSYDLFWDEYSFLKLVLWVCSQSKILGITDEDLKLSTEEIKEKLERLWGKKLGNDKSKEAYSSSWIFSALTDFNGRLQARDIVRFLYCAADQATKNDSQIKFPKWSSSRLFPPQAIRRALKPCSEEKVKEAKEEYNVFKVWVEEELPNYSPSDLKIPFSVSQFNMDSKTRSILEQMGVIYEDKDKDNPERFYIPEIFREGLGFTYANRARPRVLALKRKSLRER